MIKFKGNELKFLRIKIKGVKDALATQITLYNFEASKYHDYEWKIGMLESAIKSYNAYRKIKLERDCLKGLYKKYKGYRV